MLVALALSAACSDQKPAVTPAPRTIEAPVRQAALREVVECRSFPAQVESRNSVTLASKVSGTVVETYVREGAALRTGQPILRIDDKDLASQEQGLAASREQVARERAALSARAGLAKTTLERMGRLLSQRVVSQEDYDKAKAEYETLTRQVEASAAQEGSVVSKLAELAALRAYTRINAPFDGILARRYVDQGAFVTAGAPLALVDDASGGYELTAAVDEAFLQGLRVGETLLAVIPSLFAEPFAARISAIVGRVDPASRTFKLKADVPGSLNGTSVSPRAGMFGRVFVPARTTRKLMLPEACIGRRGDLPTVLAVTEAGAVDFRVVKTGGAFLAVDFDGRTYLTDSEAFGETGRERFVDILSGLSDGERLACGKLETLRQGDHVTAIGASGAGAGQ